MFENLKYAIGNAYPWYCGKGIEVPKITGSRSIGRNALFVETAVNSVFIEKDTTIKVYWLSILTPPTCWKKTKKPKRKAIKKSKNGKRKNQK
ncbi:hypothetical protein [Taibaiella koreensis]|uniref:hypothetical protein n=1 Tax=Taibaiella koreensis TaxID=1268548 RepID=UPI000E5A039F|nr:hypothetical protein [Taibaiella koreensis]